MTDGKPSKENFSVSWIQLISLSFLHFVASLNQVLVSILEWNGVVLIIPHLLIIVVAVLVILYFCLRTKETLEGVSGDLDLLPRPHLVTERVVVVVREEEDKVDDDSPRHYQLQREDGVDFSDEASPDGFVPEVEACSCLLIFRNGDPGLIGLILHHGLYCQANQSVITLTF